MSLLIFLVLLIISVGLGHSIGRDKGDDEVWRNW